MRFEAFSSMGKMVNSSYWEYFAPQAFGHRPSLFCNCLLFNSGPVNKLLSWPGFVPLSKITYCAYLLHPIVIWIIVRGTRYTYIYTDLTFVSITNIIDHVCHSDAIRLTIVMVVTNIHSKDHVSEFRIRWMDKNTVPELLELSPLVDRVERYSQL